MFNKISIVIITKNEEENIKECLESVQWADEIVVVDDFSADKTLEIVRQYTDKVFLQKWLGYSEQKRFAFTKAKGDWILSLDADERVSAELQEEIKLVVKHSQNYDGFYLPYKNYFLGKWIEHCGWYPEYHLRLFRKEKGTIKKTEVDESISVKGSIGYLKNSIIHYSYRSISQYFEKFNRYTTLVAQEIKTIKNRKQLIWLILTKPLRAFKKAYIKQKGYKDGMQGFILCVFSFFYWFVLYAKYWEKKFK